MRGALALLELPDGAGLLPAPPGAPLVRVRGALPLDPLDDGAEPPPEDEPPLEGELGLEPCEAPLLRVVTGALPLDVGAGAGVGPAATCDPLVRVRGAATTAAGADPALACDPLVPVRTTADAEPPGAERPGAAATIVPDATAACTRGRGART